MTKITRIHQNKQPIRRHFIAEWLEAKNMTPMELLEELNDPERDMAFTEVDKSQVYRWLKGQMPNAIMQARIAAILGHADDPSIILRPPEMDWMSDFFRDRSREELERMKTMLEAAFPKDQKTGTD